MAGNPDWHDPESSEGRELALKVIGRCIAGWLAGYLISLLSSILFFLLLHISPQQPASAGVLWATALYGIFFAALGAIVGASFCRPQALGIGAAIAATIAGMSMWAWFASPNAAHWSQAIAILLMAPAAQFAALFRRLDY